MPIIEDIVKSTMGIWLENQGYTNVQVRLGTRQGHDVEAISPLTGKKLVIECKGEGMTGNQHSRSWPNVASAILTSLNETEDINNNNDVAIALPDTIEYRERMRLLKDFCKRQQITIYWVSNDGKVCSW